MSANKEFETAHELERMKSVVMQLHALWNTGDLDAIPRVYAPDFVAHMPKGWSLSEFHGHDGARLAIERIRTAFPDWNENVHDVIVQGAQVVTRYTSTGTHKGLFLGRQATGNRVEVDEISIYRIRDGKVAEQWCLVDDLTFGKQLGILPA